MKSVGKFTIVSADINNLNGTNACLREFEIRLRWFNFVQI